jgi:hypothetical protein
LSETCYQFTRAITRLPARSIIHGLRAEDVGDPDYEQMLRDHAHYVATLKQAGTSVTELPALEDFPDSVFVEDVALCLPEAAILMRPGAASRFGEVADMAPVLRDVYAQVIELEGPGFIEGGDILTTAREILVGRSERPTSISRGVVRISPPSIKPGPSSSITWAQTSRNTGAMSATSPKREAAPGRINMAASGRHRATSSTKTESGKSSSAVNSVTLAPACFRVAT